MTRCDICQKKPLHPDKKCCFNCGRSDTNCGVWHECGKDCPGWDPKQKISTGFDTQVCGGTYRLQFETDKEDLYQTMQAAARWCLDGKPESDLSGLISVADCPCDGCKQHCPHPAKCVMFTLWLNKTIDAAPVVRAHWEEYSGCGNNDRRCSNCHDYYTDEPKNLYHCPRCGAIMDKFIPRNLSKRPEEAWPWLFPDSIYGRNWHSVSELLPQESGDYYVVIKDTAGTYKDSARFDPVDKTWTPSIKSYRKGFAITHWRDDDQQSFGKDDDNNA